MIPNTVALDEYLKPFSLWLDNPKVSEILISQPGKVFIEESGTFKTYLAQAVTARHMHGLANLIARFSEQHLSERMPLLSGQLPGGHRIQLVLPPATAIDRVVLSIRKQTLINISLADYETMGFFDRVAISTLKRTNKIAQAPEDNYLSNLLSKKEYVQFMREAILLKKNILISGATSTGKTTFLNACLQVIPAHEHIVTLEDVPELLPLQPMHTPLFASKGMQGTAKITMQDLVQAALRIRPDRIILGELRGAEAADFINATATGHDGSLSSVHAASPAIAFMRLVHMVQLNGTNLNREDILEDLHTLIDVVVQLKRRIEKDQSVREVAEIYFAAYNQ